MSITKKKYDKTYFENLLHRELSNSQRNRKRLKEILKHKTSGRLLEIGCGKGKFLELAAKHFSVEGIDISKYAVNSINATLNVNIKDIEKTGLIPNYYDVIVIFSTLEHLKKPILTIKKIYSGLKEGGILIGSVPNNFALMRLPNHIIDILDQTHCSIYKPNQWHNLFEKTGFKKATFFGEVILTKNTINYVKNNFWRYISLNLMFLCKKQQKLKSP